MVSREAFGAVVRARRKALGLTQEELGRRVGCSTITIRKIELGQRGASRQKLEQLAHQLEVPIGERAAFIAQGRSAEVVAQGAGSVPGTDGDAPGRETYRGPAGGASSFGRWVKQRRKALDLTQAELAQRIGCALQTVRKIELEKRRPSKQLAELMASALDVPEADRPLFLKAARAGEPAQQALASIAPDVRRISLAERGRMTIPAAPTLLIGAEQTIAVALGALREGATRLLTLLGPAGIGKTRLSVALAADLTNGMPDGVFFVPLAPVTDPALALATIAQVLRLPQSGGESLLGLLKAFLCDKQLLLILDNLEQVLSVGPALAELLESCPRLQLMVTSRAPLGLRWECQLRVPPLALPDMRHLPPVELAARVPAIALFLERVRALQPAFALSETNLRPVAQLCARMAGLPLAIELVAACCKLLPPQALLARLGPPARSRSLKLLQHGAADLPARQRTLRDAIAWSYNLLEPAERQLLAQLGVFVGEWTLAAAEAVVQRTDEPDDLGLDILHGLRSLVDQSLLTVHEQQDGPPLFGMVEMIRAFALEQLELRGQATAAREWHARYYLAQAEALEPGLAGAQQGALLRQLDRDHENLRAALDWAIASGRRELAARLAAALWPFWYIRGHLSEGRQWLERVLALGEVEAEQLRGKVLHGAGVLSWSHSDTAAAMAYFEQALALFRQRGDGRQTLLVLHYMQWLLITVGDHEGVAACCSQSLALARELGDRESVATALANQGWSALYQHQPELARELGEESVAIFRALEQHRGVAGVLSLIGWSALQQGRLAEAEQLFAQARSMCEELSYVRGIGSSSAALGWAALLQGRYDQAQCCFVGSLRVCRDMSHTYDGLVEVLEGLGCIAAARGDARAAGRCWGAMEAILQRVQVPPAPLNPTTYQALRAELLRGLDQLALAAGLAQGRMLSAEQAIDENLLGHQTSA